MNTSPIICLFLALGAAGCGRSPEIGFAPPAQHPPTKLAAGREKAFIEMSDPYATEYIVQDIGSALEGGAWRWTFDKPELRFALTNIANLELQADLAIPQATFKDTGPVTVSFLVNDRAVGSMRCPQPGTYRFRHAVPSGWVQASGDTMLSAEASPLWKSTDGKHLGFILVSAGFVSGSR